MGFVNGLMAVAEHLLALVVQIFPYFLLATAAAAALALVPPHWIVRLFGAGTRSVWLGAILAAVLPGCSCATIPMTDSADRERNSERSRRSS